MSPGKEAYEKRKQEKKDRKMDEDKSREDRKRREEKADACVELVIDALTLFLKGDARIVVTHGLDVRHITFERVKDKEPG